MDHAVILERGDVVGSADGVQKLVDEGFAAAFRRVAELDENEPTRHTAEAPIFLMCWLRHRAFAIKSDAPDVAI